MDVSTQQYVIFNIEKSRFALKISVVERILRAVEITPLPKAPEIVLGIINVQGQIIPVVNIRKRFMILERELELTDIFIVTRTDKRVIAIVANGVSGVAERLEQEVTMAEQLLPGIKYVDGIVKLEDGTIVIIDLDKFLSLEEEEKLDTEMRKKLKRSGK